MQINGTTAGKIANVVNTCLRQNGKAEYSVNPMEINESSIQVLVQIAENALDHANWIAACNPRSSEW